MSAGTSSEVRSAAGRGAAGGPTPPLPRLVSTRADLADTLARVREGGGRVLLVPTMGALHAGHAALLAHARAQARRGDAVVVSVFVNPLQFGPGEDLARYPRDLDADLAVCAQHGVDVVLAPGAEEVYPDGEPQVTVEPGPLGRVLEGASRPGHFAGVLTVVAKLFGLVGPDVAVFGEKDYQQLVLVRRMVADLCLGIDVRGAETVREPDGLALSSRNRYLDPPQRRAATVLSRALRAGAAAGVHGREQVVAAAREQLREGERTGQVAVDYLTLAAPDLGDPPATGPARLLVAARVGSTRLVDNTAVTLGSRPGPGDAPAPGAPARGAPAPDVPAPHATAPGEG